MTECAPILIGDMSVADYVSSWRSIVSRGADPLFFSSDGAEFLLSKRANAFFNFWIQTSPKKECFSTWLLQRAKEAREKAELYAPVSAVLCCDEGWLPAGWKEMAERGGFRFLCSLVGMRLEIADLVPSIRPHQNPLEHLQIRLASESDETSRDFARLNSAAYHIADEEFQILEKKTFFDGSKTAFVAYSGNEAVCSVYVFPISPTCCYVAWVATAEKHRKKVCFSCFFFL